MAYTLERLAEYYDYILLDLPPVTVVSDALISSKLTAGMIVVVRQDYAGKAALAETMRQLKYVNAKVLVLWLTARTRRAHRTTNITAKFTARINTAITMVAATATVAASSHIREKGKKDD